MRGRLVLPGTPRPRTRVLLRLMRREKLTRKVRVKVEGGAFRVRLRDRAPRRVTIVARYRGSRAYEPAVARLRLSRARRLPAQR